MFVDKMTVLEISRGGARTYKPLTAMKLAAPAVEPVNSTANQFQVRDR